MWNPLQRGQSKRTLSQLPALWSLMWAGRRTTGSMIYNPGVRGPSYSNEDGTANSDTWWPPATQAHKY